MSIAHLVPIRVPSCLCFFCVSGNDVHRFHGPPPVSFRSRLYLAEISSCSRISSRADEFKVNSRNKCRVNRMLQFLRFHACPSTVCRSKMNATDTRLLDNSCNNGDVLLRMVQIPVTCYQVIGLRDQAEKDEIVKSVMALKSSDVEEGYSKDVVASRQNFLMDVRDKLLFEPEYTGNVKDKIPPKSSLQIPWSWLPAALCLLQEVGEEKLVLDIGQEKLQHPDAKPFVHDLLLCMALAECAIAKAGFEKNNISQGFEALARAQCLLRSKVSLGKVTLLSQIEESLEKLAPACTLEILGLPHTPANAERRLGAIAALRELLRQGLDVEATCQVQDWPSFLSQALLKLMAVEIVNLLHWDTLAVTRKNKKSIESHNQRVIIDFNCFYLAWMAHLALGFSSKQTELINKAKTICECLKASDGIDLKFEEAFCSFLLGQVDEAEAVEMLQKLEIVTNNSSQNPALRKDQKDLPSAKQSLETWLKDNLLASFADTRDSSPSLVSFFARENRTSGNKQPKGSINMGSHVNPRPLHRVIASDHRTIDKPLSFGSSSQHLGPAVKQLAPLSNSEATLLEGGNLQENIKASNQFQRNLGGAKRQSWFDAMDIVGKVSFLTALGCLLFATLKMSSALKLGMMGRSTKLPMGNSGLHTKSSAWNMDSSFDHYSHQAPVREQTIPSTLNSLLSLLKISVPRQVFSSQQSSSAASLSSSMVSTWKIPMSLEEAEMLVKQWQATKAEALGPSHEVHSLCEILDGQMLAQWQALADEAKGRSCFWKFVLLNLSITRAEISLDGNQGEIAEIEAVLEEAAELVDHSQPKNPNYYSTYRIQYILRRLDDGSWRIFEGDIIAVP